MTELTSDVKAQIDSTGLLDIEKKEACFLIEEALSVYMGGLDDQATMEEYVSLVTLNAGDGRGRSLQVLSMEEAVEWVQILGASADPLLIPDTPPHLRFVLVGWHDAWCLAVPLAPYKVTPASSQASRRGRRRPIAGKYNKRKHG